MPIDGAACASNDGTKIAVICEEKSKGKYDYAGRVDKEQTIECPAGQTIQITCAFYGRDTCAGNLCFSPDYWNCLDRHCPTKTSCTCSSGNALAITKTACDGKQSCLLKASPSVYGEPCPGENKYLRVAFDCKGTTAAPPATTAAPPATTAAPPATTAAPAATTAAPYG